MGAICVLPLPLFLGSYSHSLSIHSHNDKKHEAHTGTSLVYTKILSTNLVALQEQYEGFKTSQIKSG